MSKDDLINWGTEIIISSQASREKPIYTTPRDAILKFQNDDYVTDYLTYSEMSR